MKIYIWLIAVILIVMSFTGCDDVEVVLASANDTVTYSEGPDGELCIDCLFPDYEEFDLWEYWKDYDIAFVNEFANWNKAVTGSPLVSQGLRLISENWSSGQIANVYSSMGSAIYWGVNFKLAVNINVTYLYGTNNYVYFVYGAAFTAGAPSYKCVGIWVDNSGTLFAIAHNGSTLDTVSLGSLGTGGERYIEMIYTAGVGMDVYKDGVYLDTVTGIPSSTSATAYIKFNCGSSSGGGGAYLTEIFCEWER